jgi:acyl carrier protein
VHVAEVERGPLGAGRRGRGPGVAGSRAADGLGRCCQCATAGVRHPLRFISIVIVFSRRLNAHLSSIVSSKPFQMPVDVIPRTTVLSGSRLSSFGFSGTIAHGAFSAQSSQRSVSSMPASLYRSRHHLSRAQHLERLSVARRVGSESLSTSAGRPAVYCKVQTISRPDSCKCVAQKAIRTEDIDQNLIEGSLPLNAINVTAGSWKRLLGMARNAPRDFLPQSNPTEGFALVGDALGMDMEVLRVVLAKAHHHANMLQSLVFPEVQSHDLMNTSVWPQSTFVLTKGAVNSISEAEVQTTRLSGESVHSVGIPTSAGTLSRMLHAQDILATAVSPMSFGTETSISLLSGASLPWREPSNQAQKEATCQYVTVGHSTTRRLPDVKTVASAPLDILETVCDVAREVMGTVIDTNAPLMSAGLDSLLATEFTSTLSERLDIEIEATALFDYPTLQSLAGFLSNELASIDVTETS